MIWQEPAQSTSVDLIVGPEASPLIFEIKSATKKNISEQVCHAIVQLMIYGLACKSEGISCVAAAVVVEHCGVSTETIDELRSLVARSGFELFECDTKNDWPDSSCGLEPWIRLMLEGKANKMATTAMAPINLDQV